jgi:hypothetical protein
MCISCIPCHIQSLISLLLSARSIPTNFGFVFQAGPIQVTDTTTTTTTTESPLPTNTSPIAITRTEVDDTVASSISTQESAPKRKRLIREEEDDRAWFQKRKRKTPKEEHTEHSLPAETTQVATNESHQEPPIEKKPTKRKVVRKRVLVPRSRKKAPTESHFEPPKDEPIPLIEPEVEALPPPKKKTKTKAPAVVKQKPKQPTILDAPLPVQEPEEQPNTHSLQPITDPVPLKRAKLTRHLRDEKTADKPAEKTLKQGIVTAPIEEQPDLEHGTTEPPKKKKVVRRVRVPKASTTTRAIPTTDGSNTDDTKPSAPTGDLHSNLSETIAPAPVTKKTNKPPKRSYFNDDSDIDLDQMLSSIAAMTGPKIATKPTTSKSGRVARNKGAP